MPSKSLKSEAPPIQSADGYDMTLGTTVYGVDKDCRRRDIPKVEPLRVIQEDRGKARTVRLRRNNGVEWTWSANGDGCSRGKLLYHRFERARKAAIDVARYNREGYQHRVERARMDLEKSQKALKDFDGEIHKLRNMKAPRYVARKK